MEFAQRMIPVSYLPLLSGVSKVDRCTVYKFVKSLP